MQLNPADFNAFIANIGQQFLWQKSYACPCINPATQSPQPQCPQCHGKGHIWAEPIAGIAGVPSQSVQRKFSQIGQWEAGDMILTIPSDSPLYDIGMYDRVLQVNGNDPFSTTLRKGFNDKLPWKAKTIQRAFWLGAGVVVDATPPIQDANGVLVFGTDAPLNGTTYSVTGTKFSEYFVYQSFPGDRGHHFGAALPLRVQLRRFDLMGRQG